MQLPIAMRDDGIGELPGRITLSTLPRWPRCSIVIPCLDEEIHIEAVVRAAMGQAYPWGRLEILVADGGSTDATRAIVAGLAAEDRRVRLVDNPGRFPSAGMNAGIRAAQGAVIVRMDAHAEYPSDHVAASVEALRRTGAANAGGAARAQGISPIQRAICAALASPLGVGGSAYRDPSREGFVESVWGGAFRREVFAAIGLFDEEARANEDAELNQRIIEAGGRVYLSRDIVAYYYPRASIAALARQYLSYGEGRARTLLRRGRLLSPRPLGPFAAVTAILLLGAAAAVFPATRTILGVTLALYAGIIAVESARLADRDLRLFPAIAIALPVMHMAHGIGFWRGLVRGARRRRAAIEAEPRLAR